MQGNPQIITLLNDVLTGELTAINQYFLHARICDNWGYKRLHKKIREESIEEMKHADKLIERILFLEGMPNVQRYSKINVGQTVKEQFTLDLAVEMDAIPRLAAGIALCNSVADHGTRELLEHILVEEEEHADWLEQQLSLIKDLGEVAYLAEQIKGDS
jgi:bacterioferritin